jgi:uncharacterized protein
LQWDITIRKALGVWQLSAGRPKTFMDSPTSFQGAPAISQFVTTGPDFLHCSPFDRQSPNRGTLVQLEGHQEFNFVPSRFNAHTEAADGTTIVWNSCAGTINRFGSEVNGKLVQALSQEGFRGPLKGFTKYLYDRGFLVKKGTDEFRRVQALIGRQHYSNDVLELFLLASEDCNFRCVYCYEDFPRGTMLPQVRERVKKLVLQKIKHLKRLSISWFGGDPLYGFDAVADLAPFLASAAEANGVDYSSNMTTNGYLLTPEIADLLLKWKIDQYQITLDGIGEVHDRKRPTRDGGPSFSRIFENLVSLQKRPEKFEVAIRVNFDRENRDRIPELLDLLNKQFGGDSRFSTALHAVGRWGGENDDNLEVCDRDESQKARHELSKLIAKDLRVDSLLSGAGLGKQVCYAARPYNFVIGADGQLMKCTVVLGKEDFNVVGRLSDDGDLLLDVDKMALWTEPAFEHDQGCQKCTLLPTCQGMHCPLVRIETNLAPCPGSKTQLRKELLLAGNRAGACHE